MKKLYVSLRHVLFADLPYILALEELVYPWAKEANNLLHHHPWAWTETEIQAAINEIQPARVAVAGGELIGYVVAQRHQHTLSLKRLLVHPDCRWQGVGRKLLHTIKALLVPRKRARIDAVVPVGDQGGCRFLINQGFGFVRELDNYYPEHPLSTAGYLYEFRGH